MTRGCRSGFVTKSELSDRLHKQSGIRLDAAKTSVSVLLGHAKFHRLVTEEEFLETVPRVDTTLACYLRTQVQEPRVVEKLNQYAEDYSRLYRRGAVISNLLAMEVAGSPDPRPRPRPPRFHPELLHPFEQLDSLMSDDDIRSSLFKQVFLPERWPTAETERYMGISWVFEQHEDCIPPLPDWQAVMTPTGWDNAINSMAVKYFANVQVYVKARLAPRIAQYLDAVALDEGTPRDLLKDTVMRRPRPLVTSNEDFEMAMRLRDVIGLPDDDRTYYPDDPASQKMSRSMLVLHLFLCRYGAADMPYLPVAARGRKYAYVDAKIMDALLKGGKSLPVQARAKRAPRPKNSQEPDQVVPKQSVSVGEMLGLTPDKFNERRAALRKQLRRKFRLDRKAAAGDATRKDRKRRLEKKWSARGVGRMPRGTRIDSVETDGIGLRMCIKTLVDITRYVHAIQAPPPQPTKLTRMQCSQAKALLADAAQAERDAMIAARIAAPAPVIAALDTGRKKLFVAATSREPTKRPLTSVFTRARFYHEMGYWRHRKWEAGRREGTPEVQAALAELSRTGGVRNCCVDAWRAYLTVERRHDVLLDAEFVRDVERALWRMRLFRFKHASLDRAAFRLLSSATAGVSPDRPLLLAVGNANFKPSGKGELPAPTSALSVALKRALQRVERSQGRETLAMGVDEFRTTLCCCGCGCVTEMSLVLSGEARRKSRRLRSCTSCAATTCKLRDRDVQASRNMLWLAQHEYFGAERPEYMSRPPRAVKLDSSSLGFTPVM